MWEKFNPGTDTTIEELLEIINDALCMGFEFYIDNHSLYFREIPYSSEN